MQQLHTIAFTGPVGAGKSTQIGLLASKLGNKGVRVKTTSLKINHFLAFILVVILVKMLCARNKRKDAPFIRALIEEKPCLFRRLFKLWLTLDVLSIYIRFLLTIYLPLKMRHIVIVEEYLPSTIADHVYVARILGLPIKSPSTAVSFMLRMVHLGGSMQTIFLDAHNNVLKDHWRARRMNLDERPDYLNMQRTILLSLSKKLSSDDLLYIDTSKQTIEETHKLITDHLRARCLLPVLHGPCS